MTNPATHRLPRPVVQVLISADTSQHQIQDLQILALHEEAVHLVRSDPALLQQAQETLERWLQAGISRSSALWRDWQDILTHGKWRKVLGRTRRAQELRQASPLVTVLPTETRQRILNEVRDLKEGITRKNWGQIPIFLSGGVQLCSGTDRLGGQKSEPLDCHGTDAPCNKTFKRLKWHAIPI